MIYACLPVAAIEALAPDPFVTARARPSAIPTGPRLNIGERAPSASRNFLNIREDRA